MVIQFWFLLLWRATSSINFSWNQLFADRAASCRWLRFRLSNHKILHVYNEFVQLRILLIVCDCVLFWLRRERRVLTMVMMLCLLWWPESAANKNRTEQNSDKNPTAKQRNSKQQTTTQQQTLTEYPPIKIIKIYRIRNNVINYNAIASLVIIMQLLLLLILPVSFIRLSFHFVNLNRRLPYMISYKSFRCIRIINLSCWRADFRYAGDVKNNVSVEKLDWVVHYSLYSLLPHFILYYGNACCCTVHTTYRTVLQLPILLSGSFFNFGKVCLQSPPGCWRRYEWYQSRTQLMSP